MAKSNIFKKAMDSMISSRDESAKRYVDEYIILQSKNVQDIKKNAKQMPYFF